MIAPTQGYSARYCLIGCPTRIRAGVRPGQVRIFKIIRYVIETEGHSERCNVRRYFLSGKTNEWTR